MIRDRSTVLLATCVTFSSLVLGATRNLKSQPEQALVHSLLNVAFVSVEVGKQEKNVLTTQRISEAQLSLESLVADSSLTPSPSKPTKSSSSSKKPPMWFVALVGTIVIAGGGIFVLLKWFGNTQKVAKPKSLPADADDSSTPNSTETSLASQTRLPDSDIQDNDYSPSAATVSLPSHSEVQPKLQITPTDVPIKNTTRLSTISIVDELIKDLREPNPQKRRKAIWELAQQGDSRAVQPLVDLLIDSDSQQRSLILEALAQIGTKTLKPLNRALAISLQDDNVQVRKNAIRDLTRIYEIVAQTSQILCNAADDPDPEVRETARWAMSQLNRIRTPTTLDNLPPSHSTILSENNYNRESQQ
jgi:hypothetical protein